MNMDAATKDKSPQKAKIVQKIWRNELTDPFHQVYAHLYIKGAICDHGLLNKGIH